MRSILESTSGKLLNLIVLLLLGVAGAFADDRSSTDLFYALELDGTPAELACSVASNTTEQPGLIVRNTGNNDVLLFFADGEERLLAPGKRVRLGVSKHDDGGAHKCRCRCDCQVPGDKNPNKTPVNCIHGDPNNCPNWHNHGCFAGKDLKEGTFANCKGLAVPPNH